MLSLLSLFFLALSMSACGSTDHLSGDHAKVEHTAKNVPNVVSGTFAVPAQKTITSLQLSYDGLFTSGVITAYKCLQQTYLLANNNFTENEIPGLFPQALYCQDNSFYFSHLTSNSGVIRATLNDNNYLYIYFDSYKVTTDITLISKDDWHNESGTSIEVD